MSIVDFSVASGLGGGILIGLSAALLILVNGNIAGISGIVGSLLKAPDDSTPWRVRFIAGMLAGGALYSWWQGQPLTITLNASPWVIIVAGLLVGLGTRLGSGCTSGHGVCGLARLSPRSLVATLTFIGVAMLTVFVTHHLIAGA